MELIENIIDKMNQDIKNQENVIKKKKNIILKNMVFQPVIYHMADIHIQNKNERYEEYQQIFDKIYKLLENDPREKIIVICGDLYDNKIIFKTNTLKFVSKFIGRLSKYGEVILINGNHDLSMINESIESTIESMLTLPEELDKNLIKNIHYLNENKIYKIKGINFGLTTMFSKEITKIINKDTNELYVGLFHGKVYGAKTDMRYNVTDAECNFRTNDFKDYDIVLLGDIHQHQFLDKNKKIAYPSSLVQKNYGETVKSHGLIIWNLNNLEGKFIEIPNEYCMCKCTLDINENLISDENINLINYKYLNVRVEYDRDIVNDIYSLEDRIKIKYPNLKSITLFNKIKIEEINKIEKKNKLEIEKISDYIYKHIDNTTYTNEQKNLMKKKTEEIILIHSLDNEINMKKIELIRMEFDNLFCYGKNNKIDFSKLNKIVGINGDNGYGKSSIIDALIYCLYQETSKSITKVVNRFKKNGEIRLFFKMNDELYLIHRKINPKNKSHINMEDILNFIKIPKEHENEIINIKYNLDMRETLIEDKKIILMNGGNKTETNKLISEIFGSFEELTENNVLLQDGVTFINKSIKERKKIIFSIFGIKPIDDFYSELTKIMNNIKSDITKEKNKLMSNEDKIKKNNEINLILEKIKILELELEINKIKLDEQFYSEKKLQEILGDFIDITELNNKKVQLSLKLDDAKKILEKYNDFFQEKNLNDIVRKIDETRNELTIEQNNITEQKNKIVKIQVIKNIDIKKLIITENINKIIKLKKEKQILIKELNLLYNDTVNSVTNINKEIITLKNILIKFETSKKILDEYLNENKFLLEHKFNSTCLECEHNKKIHDDINYIGKINQLNNFILNNANVNDKIIINEKILFLIDNIATIDNTLINLEKENKINEEMVKIDDDNHKFMDNNKQIMESVKLMETIYNKKNYDYDIMIINYNKIKDNHKIINDIDKELEKIENLKNKYEENFENIQKLKNNLIDKNINLDHKKNIEFDIKKMEKEKILLENDFKINDDKQKDLDKKVSEKNDYERIHNLFIIDKILDKKINTIINNLESIINNILNDLTDFTLKFELSVDGMDIYKVKDNEIIDARLLSGYEKFSANLALRIAFCKLNEYVRSDFLIIDEGFTASSQNNLQKMEGLFDIIRKYFKWCITVSHLDQIKSNYDNMFSIQKIKCGKTSDSFINV